MSAKSPCVRQCCLDDKDICVGCYRSLKDILEWHSVSDQDKERIVNHARMRKHQADKASGRMSECSHPKLP